MTHSMRVSVLCPICDDGDTSLDVTVQPDEIEEIVGACGHEDALWQDPAFHKTIWAAVADEEQGRYEDAMASRYEAWSDER